MGELGKDTGGVTREMWRLFGNDIKSLCDGQNDKFVFRHDSSKVQVVAHLLFLLCMCLECILGRIVQKDWYPCWDVHSAGRFWLCIFSSFHLSLHVWKRYLHYIS